jgi:hypothetical protein
MPAIADLDADGSLDTVVGTGNMPAQMVAPFHPMAGTQMFAFRADGSCLPGWPVTVGRNVTSSPAVGDLDGDGRPDVAFVAEDGFLYAFRSNGSLLFKRCSGNDTSLPPNTGASGPGVCPVLHVSPTIADVFNTGHPAVLSGGEQWIHVYDSGGNVTANGETIASTNPMTATPTAPIVLTPGGAIGDRWTAAGGRSFFLGAPTSPEFGVPGGRAQHFEGGDIYWSAGTGAKAVYGAILARYNAVGGPRRWACRRQTSMRRRVDVPPTSSAVGSTGRRPPGRTASRGSSTVITSSSAVPPRCWDTR